MELKQMLKTLGTIVPDVDAYHIIAYQKIKKYMIAYHKETKKALYIEFGRNNTFYAGNVIEYMSGSMQEWIKEIIDMTKYRIENFVNHNDYYNLIIKNDE